MKKSILQFLSLFVCVIFTACTEEPNASVQMNDEASDLVAKSSTPWDGIIGIEKDGKFEIVADQNFLKADLEKTLQDQGTPARLTYLAIEEKIATNNPSDRGYMLIGGDANGTSIGVFLEKNFSQPHNSHVFTIDRSSGLTRTSCRGCAQGCNLQYLTIDGKKIPICNENGCMYNCEKIETSK